MRQFYTYLWLREDGTPFYVGKGTGQRAYTRRGHRANVPPKERIVIYLAQSEADAFETEVALIWYYGRKDVGTGCLRNLTDGGEGASGCTWSEGSRSKLSIAHKGVKPTEKTRRKLSESLKGNKRSLGFTPTEETRLKLKLIAKNRSEDTRYKLSMSGKGNKNSLGIVRSEETRRKISESMKRLREWQKTKKKNLANCAM